VEQLTGEINALRTTIANLERELSEVKEAAANSRLQSSTGRQRLLRLSPHPMS
jgi:hypothetical protein